MMFQPPFFGIYFLGANVHRVHPVAVSRWQCPAAPCLPFMQVTGLLPQPLMTLRIVIYLLELPRI
jgi:hypothetical protein